MEPLVRRPDAVSYTHLFCDDEMQVAAKHVEVAARDLEIAPLPDASAAPAESQDANAAAALSSLQQKGTNE